MNVRTILISICLACSISAHALSWHPQPAGDTWPGNPLKGMLAFYPENYSFPHTMEWFYLPVNSVQKSMTVYDWTALENRLAAVASRGHQAVFRFYYDYPGEASGIPSFVTDAGLTTHSYNEPQDLGGGGLCPDYGNEYFIKSMEAFISEFGARYDGDGRIGFITIGLLGFWGEWHNWPFDDVWGIPTNTFVRVLNAFENAFKRTKLCVREPKWGINYTGRHVGFHDDSFAYATLSKANGGQDWSFWQKMLDYHTNNMWQTEAIGGEVYPPIQNVLFNGGSSECQNWETCVQETHATWMLCERIKYYQGWEYNQALAAANQLGYDLQVTSAYFDDITNREHLPFTLQIINNGVAPFYYGPDLWPIAIGLRQNKVVRYETKTPWDLRRVAADKQIYTFDFTWERTFAPGTYEICVRVVNPIANGKIFGFANANQETSGWLPLGTLNVRDAASVKEASLTQQLLLTEGQLIIQLSQATAVTVTTLTGQLLYQGTCQQLQLHTDEPTVLVRINGQCYKLMRNH